MKIYHGSPNHGIEKFELGKTIRQYLNEGEGIYLTEDLGVARTYAGSDGAVYEVIIKNGAVFDATKPDDFKYCLKLFSEAVGRKIQITKDAAKSLEKQIERIIEGYWSVTNFPNEIRNIVLDGGIDDYEPLDNAIAEVQKYMDDHQVIKYYDNNINNGESINYVVRDPNIIKIVKETPIADL